MLKLFLPLRRLLLTSPCTALFLALLSPSALVAAPLSAGEPRICVGFNGGPEDSGEWGDRSGRCPKNFGVFGTGPSLGNTAETVSVVSTCCPLPNDDIFTADEIETDKICPDGFVAVGGDGQPPVCADCVKKIPCRKINDSRYQLSAPQPGIYWGFGSTYWNQPQWLVKGDIPAALRFALGRVDRFTWLSHGCVGLPYGSLFVGKSGKTCSQKFFRQLQYRGLPGDPPAGTPVQIFPPCDSIDDIFSPNPSCNRTDAAR